MERVKMTLDLDSRVATAIQRRARNLGITEGEFVSRTLYESLDLGVLDELRNRPPIDARRVTQLAAWREQRRRWQRAQGRPSHPRMRGD